MAGRHSAGNTTGTASAVIATILVMAVAPACMAATSGVLTVNAAPTVAAEDRTVNAVPPVTVKLAEAVPAPNQTIINEREEQARAEEAARQAEAAKQAEEAKRAAWTNPTGQQPDLSKYGNLAIRVDLAEQKVHITSDGHDIYVMKASTGMDDTTPHGHYVINGLRGDSFYNPREQMGARDWVGFIGGTYLFHSVPTDVNGNWIESEAEKLGQPASHGCVRLTVADAAWFRQQIPDGTPIDIE